MKLEILKEIIKKKNNKLEFAIVTNLLTAESEIFEEKKSLSKNFEKYNDQINKFYKSKKNGVIENTDIFIETYIRPIKVIIVGAVHIAQYLVDYAKSLNFEISIIDPRGYFASEQRFPNMTIINKWPEEAFKEMESMTIINPETGEEITQESPASYDLTIRRVKRKNQVCIEAVPPEEVLISRDARSFESSP